MTLRCMLEDWTALSLGVSEADTPSREFKTWMQVASARTLPGPQAIAVPPP